MLRNYKDISFGCKDCCHEGEPWLYWIICEFCIRNVKAIKPIDDKWEQIINKDKYYIK